MLIEFCPFTYLTHSLPILGGVVKDSCNVEVWNCEKQTSFECVLSDTYTVMF